MFVLKDVRYQNIWRWQKQKKIQQKGWIRIPPPLLGEGHGPPDLGGRGWDNRMLWWAGGDEVISWGGGEGISVSGRFEKNRHLVSFQRSWKWISTFYHFWTVLKANLGFVTTVLSKTRSLDLYFTFWAHYVVQINLKFAMILPQPPERCDYGVLYAWLSFHLTRGSRDGIHVRPTQPSLQPYNSFFFFQLSKWNHKITSRALEFYVFHWRLACQGFRANTTGFCCFVMLKFIFSVP